MGHFLFLRLNNISVILYLVCIRSDSNILILIDSILLSMNNLFKSIAFSLVGTIVLTFAFIAYEASPAYAVDAPDTVVITLNVTAGISITTPADSSMSTALGVSQHSAIGTTTWNVKTNSAAGYALTVQASTNPAMQDGSNFVRDYQTGAPNLWVASSSSAMFGYSAFGTDVPTGTWGSGSLCYGGTIHSSSTSLKYKGFTTSPVQIGTRAATTTPAGVDSTVCYNVEQNGFYIPSGTYTATITATATTL
jgi:hypothetical protein